MGKFYNELVSGGLLLLLLTCTHVQAQVFSSHVISYKTNQPVPFATVKVLNKPIGTFSDKAGAFELEASSDDTLLITCIGFQTKKVVLSLHDTIFLEPVIKDLPLFILRKTRKTTTKIVGIKAKKDFRWGPSGFNEEFAQKMILNLKDGEYCQVIKVTLSAKHFSPDKPVLLHVYSVHPSTGLPDKELLSKAHIITAENFQRDKIVIDIEEENLYVNENVFVSFEWLAHSKKNSEKFNSGTILNMTNAISEPLTYSRTLVYSPYHWFKAIRYNGKTTNTMFTMEIK